VRRENAKEQFEALAGQVKRWINDGIEPEAIGVIARTTPELDGARAVLANNGVSNLIMGREIAKGDGVRLRSMHRMKGLEFMAVAVINVDDDTVPAHWELTDKSADEVQHRVELLRERCLLYAHPPALAIICGSAGLANPAASSAPCSAIELTVDWPSSPDQPAHDPRSER